MTALDVIAGNAPWSAEAADVLTWLAALPEDCVDLAVCSPPYERARLYLEGGKNLAIARETEAWVSWLVEVAILMRRVCKGLCVMVVEGQTKSFRYSAGPLLLAADLHRRGFCLRKPPIYRRVGIPGSGGPDWWRNDYEYAVCWTRGGKLPWSDNTATGHPPKWAPGGAMAHRLSDGTRVNQWGRVGGKEGMGNKNAAGEKENTARPSHKVTTKRLERGGAKGSCQGRRVPAGTTLDGVLLHEDACLPPAIANPGNVITEMLTIKRLVSILEVYSHATSVTADEILRDVQKSTDSAVLPEWLSGVIARILQAAILQSHLQGNGAAAAGWTTTGRSAAQGEENRQTEEASNLLREMREEGAPGSPSQGRESYEQQLGEPGGAVPLVPSEGTQTPRMLGLELRQSLLRAGLLQQALPALQEVWQSARPLLRAWQAPDGSDVIHCVVGGGQMGSPMASLNEAPFPEALVEPFVRCFAPPGGIVLDPFLGSGTTVAVAVKWGRRAIGCDLRQSQVDIVNRRMKETETLFDTLGKEPT